MVTIHVEVQQCYTTLATIDPRFKHIFLSRLGFYKATEQTASSPLYHEVIISNGIEIFDAESFRDPDFRFGVCPSCLRALKNSKYKIVGVRTSKKRGFGILGSNTVLSYFSASDTGLRGFN